VNQIIRAKTDSEIRAVRLLFEEYAASIGVDLCFQNFEHELSTLPGAYGPPRGALFFSSEDGSAVGCIALRPFSDSVGELKRLYVVPAFRGRGIARSLVSAIMTKARNLGYQSLVLDTLSSMHAAIALYESFGFRRAEAYYPNPLPGVLYFRAALEPRAALKH
jgi:ribosomal protein S18 acetylase RimI-like enzyme